MTATISSTEKSRKSGLTTIWLPPRGGAGSAGAGAAAGPGNSWKTLSTRPISSSANCPADMGAAAGAPSTPSRGTSISSSASASSEPT